MNGSERPLFGYNIKIKNLRDSVPPFDDVVELLVHPDAAAILISLGQLCVENLSAYLMESDWKRKFVRENEAEQSIY